MTSLGSQCRSLPVRTAGTGEPPVPTLLVAKRHRRLAVPMSDDTHPMSAEGIVEFVLHNFAGGRNDFLIHLQYPPRIRRPRFASSLARRCRAIARRSCDRGRSSNTGPTARRPLRPFASARRRRQACRGSRGRRCCRTTDRARRQPRPLEQIARRARASARTPAMTNRPRPGAIVANQPIVRRDGKRACTS